MKCLAIDTAAQSCAAAVFDTKRQIVLGETTRDIGKGHAEILMDVIGEALDAAQTGYEDLGRVAATAGPGSFTGIRVGLATARGIALGLDIPVFGISTLEAAFAAAKPNAASRPVFAALDARRDEAFCQYFGNGEGFPSGPFASSYDAIAGMLEEASDPALCLCGSGSVRINASVGNRYEVLHTLAAAPIGVIAALGANMALDRRNADPVYLRGADAKPQSGFALPRM